MSAPLPLVFDAPRRGLPPRHLLDLDPGQRREAVAALGEKPFRAEQLTRHVLAGRRPAEMTDLGPATRERLAPLCPDLLTAAREIDCDAGATRKSVWRLHDGTLVESVLMRYADRTTVCVSSQAGCGMACPFCATGQGGLTRNLSTAEIVEQVAARAASGSPTSSSWAWASRSPTTAACSAPSAASPTRRRRPRPVPAQRRGVDRRAGPGDREAHRRRACRSPSRCRCTHPTTSCATPWCRSTPAGRSARSWPPRFGYTRATGRRLSIEYAMIKGVNDQPERADLLGRLLRGKLVHVNLIPLNPTPGSEWDASPKPVEREFVRRLRAAGRRHDGARHPRPGDRRRLRAAGRRRGLTPGSDGPGCRAQPAVVRGSVPVPVTCSVTGGVTRSVLRSSPNGP